MRLSGPHLPSNMFSIPRQSCVRLGEKKLPPTQHMAGPPIQRHPVLAYGVGRATKRTSSLSLAGTRNPLISEKKEGGVGEGRKKRKNQSVLITHIITTTG